MGALISKTHLKGALIRMRGRGLIGRRVLNRIALLEAILTGKQPLENIYTVLCVIFFPSCRLKFPRKNCGQMSGKYKASDRTNLGTSAALINC